MRDSVSDWLRYSSFALASGSAAAWLLPANVVFLNLGGLASKTASLAGRSEEGKKYVDTTPALVPWWR